LGERDSLFLAFDLLNLNGDPLNFANATYSFYFSFYLANGNVCAKPSTSTAFFPGNVNIIVQPSGPWANATEASYVVELEDITAELGACPAVAYKLFLDINDIGASGLYRPFSNANNIPAISFTSRTYNKPLLIMAPQA
jgi:hypothetical protein